MVNHVEIADIKMKNKRYGHFNLPSLTYLQNKEMVRICLMLWQKSILGSDWLEIGSDDRLAMVGWRQQDLQKISLTRVGFGEDPPMLKLDL